MKRLLSLILTLVVAFEIYSKDFGWICAIEWTEKQPEWVFVYEDVKLQSDGCYRIFLKWEFPNDPSKSMAMQTWLISPDFDKIAVVKSVGYNKDGKVEYSQDTPYRDNWEYVMPNTYSEAIVTTAKEILLKQ